MSAAPKSNVSAVFGNFVGLLETEANLRDEIRDSVKEVDRMSRELSVGLSDMHLDNSSDRLPEILQVANTRFKDVRKSIEGLVAKVPVEQYYIFHDLWRFTMQKLVFAGALVGYLEHGRLASLEEIAAVIGVKADRKLGFHLDLEDYLFGLLNMASELSRYCVNRVTGGDYRSPGRIFTFLSELSAGFRLLNLKNGDLRRRFDSLKYDEKKVEEVIYDLSVRGLLPKDHTANEPGTFHVISEKTRLGADFSDSTSMQE